MTVRVPAREGRRRPSHSPAGPPPAWHTCRPRARAPLTPSDPRPAPSSSTVPAGRRLTPTGLVDYPLPAGKAHCSYHCRPPKPAPRVPHRAEESQVSQQGLPATEAQPDTPQGGRGGGCPPLEVLLANSQDHGQSCKHGHSPGQRHTPRSHQNAQLWGNLSKGLVWGHTEGRC